MATHSNILAWEIPQRSLAVYSPWGHKESDTTEHTHIILYSLTTMSLTNRGVGPCLLFNYYIPTK